VNSLVSQGMVSGFCWRKSDLLIKLLNFFSTGNAGLRLIIATIPRNDRTKTPAATKSPKTNKKKHSSAKKVKSVVVTMRMTVTVIRVLGLMGRIVKCDVSKSKLSNISANHCKYDPKGEGVRNCD
jgi:hypothetical protein